VRTRIFKCLPWAILSLWLVWLLGVLAHGAGADLWPFRKVNFERSGEFGDSFGTLASLMAALAATGAFMALNQQRIEAREQRLRSERQSFETTLFHLFEVLAERVRTVQVTARRDHDSLERLSGPEAFEQIIDVYPLLWKAEDEEPIREEHGKVRKAYDSMLGHYFRWLHHILLFIHDEPVLSLAEKYRCVRFLRAQLSNPELILVLINGLYPKRETAKESKERDSFLMLAADYDFFQTLREDETLPAQLRRRIPPPALAIREIQAQMRAYPRRVDPPEREPDGIGQAG